MGWNVYGDRFETADFSGDPAQFQVLVFDSDIALKAIRSWFIFFNDPSFTSISMRIYSFKNSIPYQLLFESDVNLTKAEILTEDNACRDIYFTFTNAPFLKAGESYAMVPWIDGYTGDSSSHVAWKRAFPDPVYTHAETLADTTLLARYPFDLTVIGGELL